MVFKGPCFLTLKPWAKSSEVPSPYFAFSSVTLGRVLGSFPLCPILCKIQGNWLTKEVPLYIREKCEFNFKEQSARDGI